MPTYLNSNLSGDTIGPQGLFSVFRGGVPLYTVPNCQRGPVPRKGERHWITTTPGHHKGTSTLHRSQEWEYIPLAQHVFVDVSRDTNGNYTEVAASARECVNPGGDAWAGAWLGTPSPYVAHQPLDLEVLVIGTVESDPTLRTAYSRFLSQTDSELAVDVVELDQTFGMVPSLVRNATRAFNAAARVLKRNSRTYSRLSDAEKAFRSAAAEHGIPIYDDAPRGLSAKAYKRLVMKRRRGPGAAQRSHLVERLNVALRSGGLLLANGHLAWSFGVMPLVGTASALQKISVRSSDALRRGAASIPLPVSIDKSRLGLYSLTDEDSSSNVWRDPYRSGSYWHLSSTPTGVHRAVVSGSIAFPVNGKLGSFIRKYIGNGPASVIEELIPWSFVWGWFLDTRIVTGELDAHLQGAKIDVRNCSVSNKVDWRFNAIGHNYSANASVGTKSDHAGVVRWVYRLAHYERNQVALPQGLAWNNRFGKKQTYLSISLLLQKLL